MVLDIMTILIVLFSSSMMIASTMVTLLVQYLRGTKG